MAKPIIAIDIDDVLSAHVPDFIRYSNEHFGSELTVNDYDEDWYKLWGVDAAEGTLRNDAYHASDTIGKYRHDAESIAVLRHLKNRYDLVIVTSRRATIKQITQKWLDSHFSGMFEAIHFAGMWDTVTEHSRTATKAAMCAEIGADFLIDDQLKHVSAVAAAGMEAILFGDYSWNQSDELPKRVTRCANWTKVEEYFDAR